MEKATADEVEAVLAHELGHWARSHPTKLLCLSQAHLLFTLSLLRFFLGNSGLLRSFRFPAATSANPPIIVAFLLSQLVMSPLDALFMLTVNAVTRRFEYEADRFAAEIGGPEMGRQLQFALKRLHVTNASTINHDWLCVRDPAFAWSAQRKSANLSILPPAATRPITTAIRPCPSGSARSTTLSPTARPARRSASSVTPRPRETCKGSSQACVARDGVHQMCARLSELFQLASSSPMPACSREALMGRERGVHKV